MAFPFTAEERRLSFWAKVDRSGGVDACWPWKGSRLGEYGGFCWKRKNVGAHRVAWILTNGEPPDDKPNILHRCDNPPCCNPAHLFPGTLADNANDMHSKGRFPVRRGDRHWSRLHPEKRPRGETINTAKLTTADVAAIRLSAESSPRLAVRYGVNRTLIWQIRTRKIWRHVA
jgi:hypothetical protein